MVEERIPRHTELFYDHFQCRRRRPSFSSALLDAISRSTDPNSIDKRSKHRVSTLPQPNKQHQFFTESPTLNTPPSWLYSSSEAETTHSRRPLRISADDFRFSERVVMKQEAPLPKKRTKAKPMSPGSKLASFFYSLFTPSSSKGKSQSPKDDCEKKKAVQPGSLSHSASIRSRPASSNRVSEVSNRYDSQIEAAASYTKPNPKPKPKPFSVNNRPSAVEQSHRGKAHSHKSVTFCLDENLYRLEKENISRDKYDKHGKYSFHNCKVLYEEEEEEGDSDSSSDLFELQNLNCMDADVDLPVFGTTHWETNRAIAKGFL